MKKLLSAVAMMALVTPAFAEGHSEYTEAVTANGIEYMCIPGTFVIEGVKSRRCIRSDEDGAILAAGGGAALFGAGIGGAGAIIAGVVAVTVAAVAFEDSDDSMTIGTN